MDVDTAVYCLFWAKYIIPPLSLSRDTIKVLYIE